MNQKVISIFIGFSSIALIISLLIVNQYFGAKKSISKDKFPLITNQLTDSSKISSLLNGLQEHGSLSTDTATNNQGRNNPFERY